MGNIVTLSKDDWSAWTGGKPAPGWVGLDPSAADNLTSPKQLRPLTMLQTFLLAGGAGNKDYRFPLHSTKQKLDQVLLNIGYNKEKSRAHAHMVAEKLMFQDICRQAEDRLKTRTVHNLTERNGPASHARDIRAPAATFGNVATAPTSITQAEVLSLIQSHTYGTENPAKKGNCHKCGKPGHD